MSSEEFFWQTVRVEQSLLKYGHIYRCPTFKQRWNADHSFRYFVITASRQWLHSTEYYPYYLASWTECLWMWNSLIQNKYPHFEIQMYSEFIDFVIANKL